MKRNLGIAALAACLAANALAADNTLSRARKSGAHPLDGITVAADVQRFQAHAKALQVIEQIAVRNTSHSPRTPISDHRLEIQLPPGAQVEAAMMQSGDEQPLAQTLVAGKEKDRYQFRVPLPPGETRFQIVYRLPYTGESVIEPKLLYPVGRFVVVLPRSMNFEAKTTGAFQSIKGKTEDSVHVVAPVSAGEHLAFRLSGTGVLAEIRAQQQAAQARETSRPGGGLGPPTDLPDPLHDYRWQILGGVCAVLTLGGVNVVRRPAARQTCTRPGKHHRGKSKVAAA